MTSENDILLGGQVNTITVKTTGNGGTVHIPWGFVAMENGTYTWDKNLTFEGSTFTFDALVSPRLNTTSINVSSGGRNSTIEFTVERGPDPIVSGQGWYEYLEELTGTYPHRQTGNRGHYAAADWIKSEFDGLGYESAIDHYRWTDYGSDRLGPGTIVRKPVSDILVITGIKIGQIANEWIVVGGHFDNAVNDRMTGEGAYDNGSGTTMMMELARAFKDIETRYTFVFAAWGGEEEGLIGSERWLEDLPSDVTIKFYYNMDMVGLGYPGDLPINIEVGPDATEDIDHLDIWEIMDNVTYEGMDIPRNDTRIHVTETRGSRSDHASFERQDIPSIFLITDWDIPSYHTPDDTLDYMIQYIGGQDIMLESFDVDIWITLIILLNVDGNENIHQGEVPWT